MAQILSDGIQLASNHHERISATQLLQSPDFYAELAAVVAAGYTSLRADDTANSEVSIASGYIELPHIILGTEWAAIVTVALSILAAGTLLYLALAQFGERLVFSPLSVVCMSHKGDASIVAVGGCGGVKPSSSSHFLHLQTDAHGHRRLT
jgi:hypothetical protein